MASEMVERVALAYRDTFLRQRGDAERWRRESGLELTDNEKVDRARRWANELGKAAIRAMREPTEAMLLGGTNASDDKELVSEVWREMIDAALEYEDAAAPAG